MILNVLYIMHVGIPLRHLSLISIKTYRLPSVNSFPRNDVTVLINA